MRRASCLTLMSTAPPSLTATAPRSTATGSSLHMQAPATHHSLTYPRRSCAATHLVTESGDSDAGVLMQGAQDRPASTSQPYPRHSCATPCRHPNPLCSLAPGHRVGHDSSAGVLTQGAQDRPGYSPTPDTAALHHAGTLTHCAATHLVTESVTTVVPG